MSGWSSVDEQRAFLAPRIRRWYPKFITGGQYYARWLLANAKPDLIVLDAGAGDGGYIHLLKGRVKKIIGLDQHAGLLEKNTIVDEKISGDLAAIPLPNESVDIITAEFVLEHLEYPDKVFQEWHRILKPGGKIVLLTPNVLNPIMFVSRITPVSFHQKLKRNVLKKEEHVHPTYYRANRLGTIRNLAAQSHLRIKTVLRAGNPEYVAVRPWLATPATLLERLISLPGLRWLQMYLVISLVK